MRSNIKPAKTFLLERTYNQGLSTNIMKRRIPSSRFDDGGVKQYLILTDWKERPQPETDLSKEKLGLLNWGGVKESDDKIIGINLARKGVEEQVSRAEKMQTPWVAFGDLGTGSIARWKATNFDYAWQAMARSNWKDGKFPHTKITPLHNYGEDDKLVSIRYVGGPPSSSERKTLERTKTLPVNDLTKTGLTNNPIECEKIFKEFEQEVSVRLDKGWWPIDGLSCEIKEDRVEGTTIAILSQDLYWPIYYNQGRSASGRIPEI